MSYGQTIIVEDDPAILDSLVEICREVVGVAPRTATTAAEAVELIAGALPAVVLLDLTLPDHDGRWVVEQLAAQGVHDRVRFVVLSAQASVGDKAADLGAYAHLAKPFSLNDVVATLAAAEAG